MLRLLGAARKRDVKATQNLCRIVIFFIICWFPLYTINCVMAFCPECKVGDLPMSFCIILSHLNSVGNPLLYAYHLKDFRAALKNFMWSLLFPNSDVKSSVVSVIHDRGSLPGSQRQFQRQPGALSFARSQRTNLLRQVTDIGIRAPGPLTRPGSIQEKREANLTASGSSQAEKQGEGDNAGENSNEHPCRNVSRSVTRTEPPPAGLSRTPSAISSSMELQTYKPLMPLLPAEIDRLEETPPASIFVIEADVNPIDSPRDRISPEDRPAGMRDEGG